MKRSFLLFALVPVAVFGLAACGDFSTTIRDTAVTLTADKTTAPRADSFRIRYEAQGRSLNRLVIDYGDGVVDSLGLQGAVTATGFRFHRYQNAGQYLVSGTLEELGGPSVTHTVSLTVSP
jgi:hypothetical protein